MAQVNRMFGAKKFQFYVKSSTPELETCLNKYRQLGVVDVRPWSLPGPILRPKVSFNFFNISTVVNKCEDTIDQELAVAAA